MAKVSLQEYEKCLVHQRNNQNVAQPNVPSAFHPYTRESVNNDPYTRESVNNDNERGPFSQYAEDRSFYRQQISNALNPLTYNATYISAGGSQASSSNSNSSTSDSNSNSSDSADNESSSDSEKDNGSNNETRGSERDQLPPDKNIHSVNDNNKR